MAAYIDQFTAESLLVIKKPPIEAPTIVPFKNNGDNTYLQDRFICLRIVINMQMESILLLTV